MNGNIYITGFMGSGKTTIGRVVAELINREFVDTDTLLEQEFGMPIREVFQTQGEPAFREAEARLIDRLSGQSRLVVATGGGIPENEANRQAMRRSGTIVYLDTGLERCVARLSRKAQQARPLWQDDEAVRQLFRRRENAYAYNDLAVPLDGNDARKNANAVILALLQDRRFSAQLGEKECPIVWSWDAVGVLTQLVRGSRVVLLTDTTVAKLRLDAFRDCLGAPHVIEITPGEDSKTLDTAARSYESLLDGHFDRDDLFVALGGGVVTDLGAFVASTFKRGMRLVLVSTSLLGCVDAAIGGKAAVNLGPAKNVIGCFSTPDAVILDIAVLRTLDQSQLSEGLIEAYKTGLVYCPELADLVDQEPEALLAGDQVLLGEVAALSAMTKARVVSLDFRESGLRRILNFGHTYGHGVEGACGYAISHGQSVALGMIVAAEISATRGLIGQDLAERIASTVKRICPDLPQPPDLEHVWEVMRHDKKIKAGKLVFVLLEGVGKAVCVNDVSKDELGQVLDRLERSTDG